MNDSAWKLRFVINGNTALVSGLPPPVGHRPAITQMAQVPPANVLTRPAVPAATAPSAQPDVTKPLFPIAGQVNVWCSHLPLLTAFSSLMGQSITCWLRDVWVSGDLCFSQADIKKTLPINSFTREFFYLHFFTLFPVLQMGSRVASTSAASSSADSHSTSPKALFPITSQVRRKPAALQLACMWTLSVVHWGRSILFYLLMLF